MIDTLRAAGELIAHHRSRAEVDGGTVLSYKLGSHERLYREVCPEPVLYMLKAEDGIDPEFITLDFLMEARGTVPREKATRVEEAGARSGIPIGQCEASERCGGFRHGFNLVHVT